MGSDDAEQAMAFHNATKYYALSDSDPGEPDRGTLLDRSARGVASDVLVPGAPPSSTRETRT